MIKQIDRFHLSLSKFVSWFTLLMAILTLLIVILRYGFNLGWIALQESVMYLHASVFMLGAAYTLKVDGHVRVDVFYRQFSYRKKALVNVLGGVFLLLPVNLFIAFVSWEYVASSWGLLEDSPQAGGLPLVFLLKTLILLFALSLTLQGIVEIARSWLIYSPSREQ